MPSSALGQPGARGGSVGSGLAGPRAAAGLEDLRWVLPYLARHRGSLAAIVALSAVSTALALAVPYLSKALIDDALLPRDRGALARITVAFAMITAAGFGLNVWTGLRYTRISVDVLFAMRLDVYRHLQRLSPRFWSVTPLGEIVSRLNNDVGELQRVAGELALAWIGNVLFLLGATALLLSLDARLFAVGLVCLPGAVWALARYRRILEARVTDMREKSATIGSFLIETLRGIRLVVSANAQEREAARFRATNDRFTSALMGMQSARYLAGGLPGIILSVGTAIVFLYGGGRVIAGSLSLGTFVAFMAYQMRLLGPIQGLMGLYAGVATARVSLRRVRQILDVAPETLDPGRPEQLGAARGELVLEDVRFAFDRGAAVLDGASMSVEPGEVVAIVGPSGGGKSTIVDLLIRRLDPDGGRLLLDGHDFRALDLAELRSRIVAVDQDPFLFHTSIRENIRYACPHADDSAVEEAARAAGLHDFVAGLPRGYDTSVGEGGTALSAGQRQRVAIARAFLADPVVLVLDEATANLDSATEAEVTRGRERLMRGRTTIVITHRADLLRGADRVLALEGGLLVERAMTAV